MNETTFSRNPLAGASSTVGDKLSDAAEQVKDTVSELGRTAGNKIEEGRDAAAKGLDKAATTLHEKAENLPGYKQVSGLAHDTAEKISSTAGYVRERNVSGMMADLETVVKNNPGPALLVAAGLGFLLGRALSSDD